MIKLFNRNSRKCSIISILSVGMLLVTGCAQNVSADVEKASDEAIVSEDELQAVDTAVVVNVNTDEKSIILQTIEGQKRYELSYDGKTEFRNKYGDAMTAAQIKPASIVDVVLSVHSKTLKNMQLAKDAFSMGEVADHKFNINKRLLTVGDNNYKVNDKMVVVMDGQVGTIADIIENDVLTINGIGTNALSATIDKGHGYLRLRGESAFLGGWVQVGQIIKPITEKMLVLVPEGDHDVHISYHGVGGGKPVHIERDAETIIDVSDLEDEILQTSEVTFDVDPDFAKLKVDGKEVNDLIPVELLYGVHKIQASARGYVPIEEYLKVGSDSATVQITLEKDEDQESNISENSAEEDENLIDYVNPGKNDLTSSKKDSSSDSVHHKRSSSVKTSSRKSSSTSSSQSTSQSSSDKVRNGRICLDDPDDVEVYFDGTYKGISPIRFEKEPGTHVITLRKDGYITKSYTVDIVDNSDDEHYSFDKLIMDEENAVGNEEEIVNQDEIIDDEEGYENRDDITEDTYSDIEDDSDDEEDDSLSEGDIDVVHDDDDVEDLGEIDIGEIDSSDGDERDVENDHEDNENSAKGEDKN